MILKNKLHNLEILKERRKQLRSELTPAEAFLWTRLSNSKLEGRKFRRQHSIGNYVVDFYCPAEKLSIELDGMPHFTEEGMEKDKKRTEYLASLRIKEIRFENAEVFEMTDEVLEKIKSCFKKS
ncbi:MAG: endonuclease domain-containing protein [Ignavibacteria bacterium]|nr:endonuclease domain-containing protein [Ignavibacteria bacterium]